MRKAEGAAHHEPVVRPVCNGVQWSHLNGESWRHHTFEGCAPAGLAYRHGQQEQARSGRGSHPADRSRVGPDETVRVEPAEAVLDSGRTVPQGSGTSSPSSARSTSSAVIPNRSGPTRRNGSSSHRIRSSAATASQLTPLAPLLTADPDPCGPLRLACPARGTVRQGSDSPCDARSTEPVKITCQSVKVAGQRTPGQSEWLGTILAG